MVVLEDLKLSFSKQLIQSLDSLPCDRPIAPSKVISPQCSSASPFKFQYLPFS